ncbi:MAG: ribosome small subunit-dependent GTPase A [Betaproteobacteria bacterium]|nr:ribosome small subunit-dependent GTPase A [Betaproteobacteria bacterium]
MIARVIATHGRHFLVAVESGEIIECVTRGKKGGVACGDQVSIQITQPGAGVIERVEERRNLLYRSDAMREKLLAANLDQALIVVAAVPLFREELLIRCLVACEAADIPARIVLNKIDLPETARLADYLSAYEAIGYPVLKVSAVGDIRALEVELAGRVSILVGASGMGKSSLLNRLVPEAKAVVGAISEALDAGRHTTTHSRLHELPRHGALIDSPGMQEFGLRHLDAPGLMAAFPELRERAGQCRFYNCRHIHEPGCAVRDAAESGAMLLGRYRAYLNLLTEISAPAY